MCSPAISNMPLLMASNLALSSSAFLFPQHVGVYPCWGSRGIWGGKNNTQTFFGVCNLLERARPFPELMSTPWCQSKIHLCANVIGFFFKPNSFKLSSEVKGPNLRGGQSVTRLITQDCLWNRPSTFRRGQAMRK